MAAMKKPRPFIIVLAVLSVLLWVWDYSLKPQTPPLIELISQVGSGWESRAAIGYLVSLEPYPGNQIVQLLTAPQETKLRAKWIDWVRQHGARSMRRRAWHAEEFREKAATALMQVGKRKGKVEADLTSALTDSRPRVRYLATWVLTEVGPESKDIPVLTGLVRDPDPGVRNQALIALAKCGAK